MSAKDQHIAAITILTMALLSFLKYLPTKRQAMGTDKTPIKKLTPMDLNLVFTLIIFLNRFIFFACSGLGFIILDMFLPRKKKIIPLKLAPKELVMAIINNGKSEPNA